MTAARFRLGDRVRIDDRAEPRHHRVPAYAKGRTGEVVRVCRAYGRPELLAGEPTPSGEPLQTLYRVRLRQVDLWPHYAGAPCDTLDLEVFEHWLGPA